MRGVEIESKNTVDRDGWNASTYHLYSHAGTHMDAPFHFACNPQTIDEIQLKRCVGLAWVADLGHLPPKSILTVGDLGQIQKKLEPGHSLILRTGWSKYADDLDYYRNKLHRVGSDLANWCVEHDVNMLGVEAPSVADVNNLEELAQIHNILLSGNVIVVEGLANLGQLQEETIVFAALPLRIENGDGSPCRAFAITDPASVKLFSGQKSV
jgi:kynurenine formamidase